MKVAVNCRCRNCPHHSETTVEIMTENSIPYAVFQTCCRQWRTGWAGAEALDGNVVWRVIDEINPANKLEVFRRVDTLGAYYLHYQRKRKQHG